MDLICLLRLLLVVVVRCRHRRCCAVIMRWFLSRASPTFSRDKKESRVGRRTGTRKKRRRGFVTVARAHARPSCYADLRREEESIKCGGGGGKCKRLQGPKPPKYIMPDSSGGGGIAPGERDTRVQNGACRRETLSTVNCIFL